eukprot:TRINITY_DN7944_c0_g1_i1.p1 TRINITY_DN7944_c0_g1~~TRINITY_DN7944_c0_g1_i1.p1  ORF type:complete len:301 (-),score=67.28 TRINITY_DN7944_c0_g1_i1:60-962(-)
MDTHMSNNNNNERQARVRLLKEKIAARKAGNSNNNNNVIQAALPQFDNRLARIVKFDINGPASAQDHIDFVNDLENIDLAHPFSDTTLLSASRAFFVVVAKDIETAFDWDVLNEDGVSFHPYVRTLNTENGHNTVLVENAPDDEDAWLAIVQQVLLIGGGIDLYHHYIPNAKQLEIHLNGASIAEIFARPYFKLGDHNCRFRDTSSYERDEDLKVYINNLPKLASKEWLLEVLASGGVNPTYLHIFNKEGKDSAVMYAASKEEAIAWTAKVFTVGHSNKRLQIRAPAFENNKRFKKQNNM